MAKYRVKVQYVWTECFEQEVEVEAADAGEAKTKAIAEADDDWERGYKVGDGDAGDTEVIEITEVA